MTTSKDYSLLKQATYLSLGRYAESQRARDICIRIAKQIKLVENRKRERRPKDARSFQIALEAVIGDLLVAYQNNVSPYCYRSLMKASFSEEEIKADTFKKVIDGLKTIGMIEVILGGNHSNPFSTKNGPMFHPGLATRFKAGSALLELFEPLLQEIDRIHFRKKPLLDCIVVRGTPSRNGARKQPGKKIKPQDQQGHHRERLRLKQINAYLLKQDFGPLAFKGLYRVFNMGDNDDFNWNKGGRLYAYGEDNFQQFKQARRNEIRINGVPVAEVDINAAYLTIFLTKQGVALPNRDDLYAIPGLPRDLAKAWIRVMFGAKQFPQRWPSSVIDHYGDSKRVMPLKVREVQELVLNVFPDLAKWEHSELTWADLMYLESEAIYSTLETLAEAQITTLPVHDSLIVPIDHLHTVTEVLQREFQRVVGVACRLRISHKAKIKSV